MVTPEQEALDTLSHALGTREQAAGVSEADIEIAFTTLYTYLDKRLVPADEERDGYRA